MRKVVVIIILTFMVVFTGCGNSSPKGPTPTGSYVYASIYTYDNEWNLIKGKVAGYQICSDGSLAEAGSKLETSHNGPCALTVTPNGRVLYVGDWYHYIYSYLINNTNGVLTYVEERQGPADTAPYFSITCDDTGQHLYTAEQDTSSIHKGYVAHYTINPVNGTFSGGPVTQDIGDCPGGIVRKDSYLYIPNTSEQTVSIFKIGADGSLTVVDSPYDFGTRKGSIAPKGVTAHPTLNYLYLADSVYKQVVKLNVNLDGTLGSPVTFADGAGNTPFFIVVEPLGRFAYTSNFGSNTVSAYQINADGSLNYIESYPCTNAFYAAVDPSGTFLLVPNKGQYNKGNSHTISVFRINQTTGALSLVYTKDLGEGNEPNFLVIVKLH